jgi:hypothetical protein
MTNTAGDGAKKQQYIIRNFATNAEGEGFINSEEMKIYTCIAISSTNHGITLVLELND